METTDSSELLVRLAYLPGGRERVVRLVHEAGGSRAVNRLSDLYQTFQQGGLADPEAFACAIEWLDGEVAVADYQAGVGFGGVFKKIARGIAAGLTGGASEAYYAAKDPEQWKKDLKKAAGKGWDAFSDSIEDAIHSFKSIDDVKDALSIVKVVVTGGASVAADAGMAAVQEVVFDQLAPYMQRLGQGLGRVYSKGKKKALGKIKSGINGWDAPDFIKKLAKEFVDVNWDILFGNPMCMCEQGCSKPVGDALKDNGNPYIKLVGQIISIVAPIIQTGGFKYDAFGTSSISQAPCLYLYGEGGVKLLVNAKLDKQTIGGAAKVIEAFNKDFSNQFMSGIPKAFERYEPWLVDMVARGADGPSVIGGAHSAKWYFSRPEEARKVIQAAGVVDRVLGKISKYLEYLNTAAEYGQKAYDLYDSYKDRDPAELTEYFKFDVDRLQSIGSWALDEVQQTARDKIQNAKDVLEGVRHEEIVAWAQVKAEKTARHEAEKQTADLKEKFRFTTPFSGVSKSQAFMGEWMPASIGLQARARYNDMLVLWADMSPDEREKWHDLSDAENAKHWQTKHIDFKAWYKKFSGSAEAKIFTWNRATPRQYETTLQEVRKWWQGLTNTERDEMRRPDSVTLAGGGSPILAAIRAFLPVGFLGGTSETLGHTVEYQWNYRVPPGGLPPSAADVGWPWGEARKGSPVKPHIYWAWAMDWLDAHDDFDLSFGRYLDIWRKLENEERIAWLKDRGTLSVGYVSQARKSRQKVMEELDKASPTKRALLAQPFGADLRPMTVPDHKGPVTRRAFWAAVICTAHPDLRPTIATVTRAAFSPAAVAASATTAVAAENVLENRWALPMTSAAETAKLAARFVVLPEVNRDGQYRAAAKAAQNKWLLAGLGIAAAIGAAEIFVRSRD